MADGIGDDDMDLSRMGDLDEGRSSGDDEGNLKGPLEVLKEYLPDANSTSRQAQTFMKRWYSVLPFRKEDIISALGGSHLFFIHGESLILHFLSKEFVAFEDNFQLISVLFMIEKFLNNLRRCGGLFRIVFFDCFKDFLSQFGPQTWLLREALVAQLTVEDVDCVVFNSFYADDFIQYLKSWQPSFLLVSDEPCEIQSEPSSILPICMLHTVLDTGIPVSLLYRMETHGTKVLSYAITPEFRIQGMKGWVKNLCEEYLNSVNLACDLLDAKNIPESTLAKTCKANSPGEYRFFFHQGAFESMLNHYKVKSTSSNDAAFFVSMCKVMMLHTALIDSLKLPKRLFASLPLEALPYGSSHVIPFIQDWCACLAIVLRKSIPEMAKSRPALGDIVDILDGCLISVIYHMALLKKSLSADYFNLPDALSAKLQSIWTSATNSTLGEFWPIQFPDVEQGIVIPEIPQANERRPEPEVVKVESFLSAPGVTALKEIDEPTDSWAPLSDPSEAMEEIGLVPKFLDSYKEILDSRKRDEDLPAWAKKKVEKLPEHKREAFLKRLRLKRGQQQQSTLRAYAKSLSGADKLHFPIVVREEKQNVNELNAIAEDSDESSDDENNKNTTANKGKSAAAAKRAEKEAKKREKEAKKAKVSTKASAIIEKNEKSQKEKMKAQDLEHIAKFEKKIDAIARETNPNVLSTAIYDLVAGIYRVMDTFGDFDGLKSTLKLAESRADVLVRIVRAIQKSLTSLTVNSLSTVSMRFGARRASCVAFRLVHDTYNAFGSILDGAAITALQDCLLSLGYKYSCNLMFNDWIDKQVKQAILTQETDSAADSKAAKKSTKHVVNAEKQKRDNERLEAKVRSDCAKFKINNASKNTLFQVPHGFDCRYQLQHMGQDLERTTGSESDPRVRFKPDGWQKRLLDIVDGKLNKEGSSESALVVAPTGSGKTFICYYAMEKILRRDNESRVVYVAPSKALVLQVSAEIYARFSNKLYPPSTKVVLQGELLREFQSKALECQILITVPECLEMLLFNPIDEEKQKWLSNLKYVIFDEVHCIGNLSSGATWERLLQLLPCPFLALSATVGNPHGFHAWLNRVHRRPKVHLVKCDERYSDLNKYTYKDGRLLPLHTLTCFNYRQLQEQGFAPDLYFTPPEALALLNGLSAIDKQNNTKKFSCLDYLNPDVYLNGTTAVTKRQYRYFLATLKYEFTILVQTETLAENEFETLRSILNSQRSIDKKSLIEEGEEFAALPPVVADFVTEATVARTHTPAPEIPEESDPLRTEKTYLNPTSMIALVRHLMSLDMLPALVFNFSRDELHRMVFSILRKFSIDQEYKYYGTDEARARTRAINKKRRDEWERKVKDKEQNEALKNQSKREAEEQGIAYDEALANEDIGPPPIDIAEEFDAEFSFANNKVYKSNVNEVEEQFESVRRRISQLPPKQAEKTSKLLDALKRGIGIHHEGTNKKYRQAVEVLFRMGFLRVVLATGTLALGVNMPCKTTVFAGDSLDLTPLMYRQMSGRAGRRGFDPIGHVIFLDFPQSTLQRLMTSRLGSLTGGYPLSNTLVLRALQLQALCAPDDRKRTAEALRKVFYEPLCVVPDEDQSALRALKKRTSKHDKTISTVVDTTAERRAQVVNQVVIHLKCALDNLYRESLLTKGGAMQGLAPFTTFMYEDAPANFVIQKLVITGILKARLERIQPTSNDPEDIRRAKEMQNRDLLLILAHFMHRRYFTRQILFSPSSSKATRSNVFSTLSPLLPPLPEEVHEIVEELDIHLFQSLQDSIYAHCAAFKMGKDELEFPIARENPVAPSNVIADSSFIRSLQFSSAPKSRSPFTCLNGSGDSFISLEELELCSRSVATVESHMHGNYTNGLSKELRSLQNSYILDFYIHGDVDRLKSSLENRMDATDAYTSVQSFIHSLLALKTALEKMQTPCKTLEEEQQRKKNPDILIATIGRVADELERKRLKVAA